MVKGLYKGFSTFEFEQTKEFQITDVECVKMNLLNHIFTKRGERVMMPNFGSFIPEMTFEPLDEDLVEAVREELQYIFEYDPRVSVLKLTIEPDYNNNTVMVNVTLRYIELNTVDDMNLNIEFAQ